jgi:hypothetical protein
MAKFVATKPAFYGNRRIEPGTVFDAPEGFAPSWAEAAAVEKKTAPKKKASARKKASKSDEKKD